MPGQGCIAQLEEQVPLKHQVVGRKASGGRTWRKEGNKMPTIDMAATGLRIKELRDKAGMSTKDIAEVFGFQNPTAVFKWMKGTSLPTVDNLVILADLFGVTIEDILVIRKNENTAVA